MVLFVRPEGLEKSEPSVTFPPRLLHTWHVELTASVTSPLPADPGRGCCSTQRPGGGGESRAEVKMVPVVLFCVSSLPHFLSPANSPGPL